MELTRNWATLKTGALALPVGALLLASPWLLDLVGFVFRLGPWIGYIAGGICVLAGIVLVADGMKRYRIGVSEQGLSIVVSGLTADLSWEQIDAVVIERDQAQQKDPEVVLVLIPAAGVVTAKAPAYTSGFEQRLGFKLMDVKEINEGHAGIVNTMTKYAGPKFTDTTRTLAA